MMKAKITKAVRLTLQGKLLMGLGVDRYLPQIIFFFICSLLTIWVTSGIESTLHACEQNKVALENLQNIHTRTKCRLTALDSVCKMEEMLEEKGSKVDLPHKKAVTIK